MEPPPTPKPTISTPPPPTSDATGQSSQFLGVLYLALTGLIDSALPEAGPWAVAGKALFYLVKLGPIIWWAMPVPALTPPSPSGAPQYSWYCKAPENEGIGDQVGDLEPGERRHNGVDSYHPSKDLGMYVKSFKITGKNTKVYIATCWVEQGNTRAGQGYGSEEFSCAGSL
ncbi:hypothetical protein DSO57_1002474 [Entomophthora muscae]|uniref:Uncharacterized protein n=1 Tax=Entomophthora muscae TaxID=34485 RepID=A0ACC2TWE8_9FUNG|nr:hypothetical protein DSO57_1002474 [Entomophthora muscae]